MFEQVCLSILCEASLLCEMEIPSCFCSDVWEATPDKDKREEIKNRKERFFFGGGGAILYSPDGQQTQTKRKLLIADENSHQVSHQPLEDFVSWNMTIVFWHFLA